MNSATASLNINDLILNLTQEIEIQAPPEAAFSALLEELGPGFITPEGKSLSAKLEAWVGGRWYRDLNDGNGHLWGHVQAIIRPTLLEITGPLFMSFAVVNNVQYRLKEIPGGTQISFHHFALGAIPGEVRSRLDMGWTHVAENTRMRAQALQAAANRRK
jgi:uncharacterized protein YndB with AHSA1/START domain